MNVTLSALDEYFAAHYSDYVRLSALKGYVMPDSLILEKDGKVSRKDPSCMRLNRQKECEALLKKLKEELADTDFTFSFRFLTFGEKLRRPFEKYSFSRVLPGILKARGITAEEAGERLAIEPRFWTRMVKGSLYPEKNTVLALALVCGFTAADTDNLFNACVYAFDEKSVRDVVVRFLLEQKIFSAELVRLCLDEYKITSLPIR